MIFTWFCGMAQGACNQTFWVEWLKAMNGSIQMERSKWWQKNQAIQRPHTLPQNQRGEKNMCIRKMWLFLNPKCLAVWHKCGFNDSGVAIGVPVPAIVAAAHVKIDAELCCIVLIKCFVAKMLSLFYYFTCLFKM